MIINELAYIVEKHHIDKNLINEAIQEVFGLSENSISAMKRIGNEKIKTYLSELFNSSLDNIYKLGDLSILND